MDIEMETRIYTLKDISLNICDGVHNTVIDDNNGECFLLSAKNIKNGIISYSSNDRRINKETKDKLSKRTKISKDDVVISTVGTIGELAIVDEKCEEYDFQRSVGIIKCNPKFVDFRFLFYLLGSYSYNYYFHVIATGAAQPCIFLSTLNKLKVQIPNLPTQQKIASILSTYDNLIQNYKKQIEVLQICASELYKEWFVRFRFPGYQTAQFENGIPVGWKVERIGEYCSIKVGGDVPEENSETRDEKYKYPIFSNGINEDGLYGFTDTFKISDPSVSISARGTVGFVCLRREPYYPIVRLICLIPKKEIGVFYLYHSLKYADLDGNGTSQQQLTAPMVSKRKIVIAEEKLIEKFNLNAKIIYNKIDLLKIQITNLTQQRDLLLPRLMSGKLEVE